jgi:O-acetyl-ADP-ribose deacetylase (regulator of RNase III)
MSYKEIYGDLVKMSKKGDFDLIAHGCNCKKNMGAGIAKQIAGSYPMAYEVDKNSTPRMGEISVCRDYDECTIVNAYTQLYPGKGGYGKDTKFHRYEAIRNAMININTDFPGMHIGLPLIGCGLAGLQWSKVKKIIKEELKGLDVTIVRYSKD